MRMKNALRVWTSSFSRDFWRSSIRTSWWPCQKVFPWVVLQNCSNIKVEVVSISSYLMPRRPMGMIGRGRLEVPLRIVQREQRRGDITSPRHQWCRATYESCDTSGCRGDTVVSWGHRRCRGDAAASWGHRRYRGDAAASWRRRVVSRGHFLHNFHSHARDSSTTQLRLAHHKAKSGARATEARRAGHGACGALGDKPIARLRALEGST